MTEKKKETGTEHVDIATSKSGIFLEVYRACQDSYWGILNHIGSKNSFGLPGYTVVPFDCSLERALKQDVNSNNTFNQGPESRVQSRFYTIPFLGVFMLSALWSLRNLRSILSRVLRLFPEHCSDIFLITTAHLHGQCGQRLPLCQSCFAVVFYQRKHLSCSILCVRHGVLLGICAGPS